MPDIYQQAAKALAEVKDIRDDIEEFGGDRLGMWYALSDAEEDLAALAPLMVEELARVKEGITLIERINCIEGRDATWRAAKMNAVAYALSNGDDLAPFRRLFPRTAGETND